jgi:hypothetical protein
MNKKLIIGLSVPLFFLLIFISYVGVNGTRTTDKLSNLLHKELGNINEIFHQYALEDVKMPQEKVTLVKDLKDFRRYLFFMPKVYFITTSAEEAQSFEKSFPKSCKLSFSNQPKWLLSVGWLADLFNYYAVFTCHKMEIKL